MVEADIAEQETNPRALKHHFGREHLVRISDSIRADYPAFNHRRFLSCLPQLESLEMKPRVQLIRDALRRELPDDYHAAVQVLLDSVHRGDLEGFDYWPYTELVQTYGLDDLDVSFDALKQLTKVFTSEWAVRPFIRLFPTQTMRFLERCAIDQDVNVRRWACEGSRPRLPWGERLNAFVHDPRPTLPILERLKFDPELFVRKSVANHLNDIAKDHPDYVIEVLCRWMVEANTDDLAKIMWVANRSLRTLIKGGHRGALNLIGVVEAEVVLDDFTISRDTVKVGERLDFSLAIRSTASQEQKLVIDYVMYFVRANNKVAPKVFKLKTVQLPANGLLHIEKSHSLHKITTRDYYAGEHSLEIQINGTSMGKRSWTLGM